MESSSKATIIPSIRVTDINKSLDFYTRTLGLQVTEKLVLRGGEIGHASVGFGSPLLMLLPVRHVRTSQTRDDVAEGKPGSGVEFRIWMHGSRSIDELRRRVKGSEVPAIDESGTELSGDNICAVTDPDGYALSFWANAPSPGIFRSLGRPQRARRGRRPYISIFSGG